MNSLYTIVFDPHSTGEWRLYDRVFYLDSSVCINRCSEYNRFSIFERYKVVKVDFTFID